MTYRRDRGSMRILAGGFGLLSLVVVIAIMAQLGKESAEVSRRSHGHAVQEVHNIQQSLDTQGVRTQRAMDYAEDRKLSRDTYDLVLEEPGEHRISLIKAIRTVTKLGLAEAKDMAGSTPVVVLRGVSKARADRAMRQIERTGARVHIRKVED